MDSMDSKAFEQTILKLGLVTPEQISEVYDEIGASPSLQLFRSTLERKGYLTPWQSGKVLKGDPDGYILGGYKLLYKIQSGSFGRVYRAVDVRDGRVVAVKVLRRRWSENEQRIEMFIREGKVGLMLKHPNIVEVLAINRDATSGQYYIVMEFVEGGNLREILQAQGQKKMSVAQSLRIIEDCSQGLAYAYSRAMTHRDIKLTNILLSDTREAKLVDFGLAHLFSTAARTEEEKVDRTVDYAGLERATDVKVGDIRSDIYFLGCVLYELLTGRSPLVMSRDKHQRMRKGRFEEVRPIHPSEFEGPPSVLMLVETMMALDPRQRYQTPSQLVDAIRRVRREVEGTGVSEGRQRTRSVFLAEPDEHLQDVLRDKLKDQGYRVFLAGDPMRALDRFRNQPFDGLIVDARTTGEEGFRVFEHIVEEAARRRLPCAAMLLLDEEQADWAERLPSGPHIGVMVEDITFKTVSRKLKELMEAAHDSKDSSELKSPTLAPSPDEEEAPKVAPPPSRPASATPPPRPKPVKPAPEEPSSPLEEEVPSSPPRRQPATASAPPAVSGPEEDDLPMLALEEGIVLPPSDESISKPAHQKAETPPPSDEEIPIPPVRETPPPPPPRKEAPPPPRQEATPPPRQEKIPPAPRQLAAAPPARQEKASAPRPVEPRKNKRPPAMRIAHEDVPLPTDEKAWRDEFKKAGKKDGKENKGSLTAVQTSLIGLVLLVLVAVLLYFFVF